MALLWGRRGKANAIKDNKRKVCSHHRFEMWINLSIHTEYCNFVLDSVSISNCLLLIFFVLLPSYLRRFYIHKESEGSTLVEFLEFNHNAINTFKTIPIPKEGRKKTGNNRKLHPGACDEIVNFMHLCRRWCFSILSPQRDFISVDGMYVNWCVCESSLRMAPSETWALSIFRVQKRPHTKTIKTENKTYFYVHRRAFLCSFNAFIHWRKHKIQWIRHFLFSYLDRQIMSIQQ